MLEMSILKEKLIRTFELYEDLVSSFQEKELEMDLAGLTSNTIGQQLWCVIGARQSYLKAIVAGEWQGFECSLEWKNTVNKSVVLNCLKDSKNQFLRNLENLNALSLNQQSLTFDLIEHEAQHQGQLIRYLYGNKMTIPDSWKKRYSLD